MRRRFGRASSGWVGGMSWARSGGPTTASAAGLPPQDEHGHGAAAELGTTPCSPSHVRTASWPPDDTSEVNQLW